MSGMTNYHIGPYRITSDHIGLKCHHIGPHRATSARISTTSDYFGPQYATITYFVVLYSLFEGHCDGQPHCKICRV